MPSAGPDSFDQFLRFMLDNTETDMSQGLKLLQKYFNVLRIFCYDTNDNRQL